MQYINFENPKQLNSQQTIVLVLKQHKYYFKSISEYDNSNFYCIIVHENVDTIGNMLYKIFGRFGYKEPTTKYLECPLGLCYCSDTNSTLDELLVFTQEDVKNIISDVPENYIGGSTL